MYEICETQRLRIILLLLSWHLLAATTLADRPPVRLELAARKGVPLTGQQRWLTTLRGLTDSLRIRKARNGDKPEIRDTGTRFAPSYLVIGILSDRNSLLLPGASFRTTDRTEIVRWINRLRSDGIDAVASPKGQFGLTEKQWVTINKALQQPVHFSTRNLRSFDVASQIAKRVSVPFALDAVGRRILEKNQRLLDDYQGLSSGTAMAALLHSIGLVMVPEQPQGEDLQIGVFKASDAEHSWPIGTAPANAPGRAFPKLFNKLTVTIDDQPLATVVNAVQKRLEVPILQDHPALAKQGIDLTRDRVTLPEQRSYYHSILRDSLRQAGMKYELRVDDRGQPFLWITTRAVPKPPRTRQP